MHLELHRTESGAARGTLGMLFVYHDGKVRGRFHTLELDYNFNKKNASSIPASEHYALHRRERGGYYAAYKKRWGHQFALEIKTIPQGRDMILIHTGNFLRNTKGCVLVGNAADVINCSNEKGDEWQEYAIYGSRIAYQELYSLLESHGIPDEGLPIAVFDHDQDEGESELDPANVDRNAIEL